MMIHHSDKEFLDLAAHAFSQGEGQMAEELLRSLGLAAPHTEGLARINASSPVRCTEQFLLDADPVTIESSQPWLGYW